MSSETCSGLGRGLFLQFTILERIVRGAGPCYNPRPWPNPRLPCNRRPRPPHQGRLSAIRPGIRITREFTLKAIVLGAIFGVIFGAVTVYLHSGGSDRVGLDSDRRPRHRRVQRFSKSTILENNIVQTIGSAGESIASGVVFTIPAFLFMRAAAPRNTSTFCRS